MAKRALRLPEVLELTGLKKTAIADAIKRGDFPKPFKILPNGRALAWDLDEIEEHIARQMERR